MSELETQAKLTNHMDSVEEYPLLQEGRDVFYESLHLFLDLTFITASWFIAVQLRLFLNPLFSRGPSSGWNLISWAPPLPGLLLLWIIAAAWQKLYQSERLTMLADTVLQIVKSIVAVTTVMAFLTFFSRQFGIEFSRAFAFIFLPVSFFCLVLSLFLTTTVIAKIEKHWPSNLRMAIVGRPSEANRIIQSMQSIGREAPIRGLVFPDSRCDGTGIELSVRVLGPLSRLAEIVNREQLNRIVVPTASLTPQELAQCERISKKMGVPISCLVRPAATDEEVEFRIRFGMHVIDLTPKKHRRGDERIKRTLDLIVSAFLLLVLGLPMLAVAALIRITSPGPILYKAPRVGRGGRYFLFLKFRTMVHNDFAREELIDRNEREGHLFKIRRDPRITSVGRVLRRYSIDELPQLINVLMGDMSLVGPRPLPAQDLDPDGMSQLFTEWAERRAEVRPGITGLWQVSGRSDLSFKDMVELDLAYVHDWSVWNDFRILFCTPSAVLSGRGAY